MKKINIILSIVLIFLLSGCMNKECVPRVEEVTRTVEKIKEVEVPIVVEKYIEVPVYEQVSFRYKPGSYYRKKDADGFTYMVHVHINEAGLIDNLFIDKTSNKILFYKDPVTNELYVKVAGIEDVIPNSYRLIRDNDLPSIKDAITVYDLVEGYPDHDKVIKTLVPLKTTNTRQTEGLIYEDNWSKEMNLLCQKIIADQTTAAIHLYNSANGTKTDSIPGVTINVGHEVDLLNNILLNEAKLTDDIKLLEAKPDSQGLYKAGTYFNISTPTLVDNEIKYNSSLVFVDHYGYLSKVYLDEYSSNAKSKKLLNEDKAWLEKINNIEDLVVLNQTIKGFDVLDEKGEKIKPDLAMLNNDYVNKFSYDGLSFNGLYDALSKNLTKAFNNFTLKPGNYYYRTKDGYIYTLVVRNIATEDNIPYSVKAGDIIDKSKLSMIHHELRVLGFAVDKILQDEEALYLKDGKEYELYTYHKAYPVYKNTKDYDVVTIYKEKGKDTYYYYEDLLDNNVFKDEKVKFENKYFDEAKTVVKARGFKTLNTKHNLTSSEKEEKNQLELVSEKVLKDNSLLSILENKDGLTTNLETPLSISKINEDLRKLQIIASNSVNASSNINDPKLTHTTHNLASGTYFGLALGSDNSKYTQMVVYNNKIISIMLDEITYLEDKDLNIFSSQKNDNLARFAELSTLMEYNFDQLISNYLYLDNQKLNQVNMYSNDLLHQYEPALKSMIKDSLDKNVKVSINKTKEYLNDLVKDNFIVESKNDSGALEISKDKLNKVLEVGTDLNGTSKLEIEFDLPKGFSLVEDATSYKIIYDKALANDLTSKIDYLLTFNKVKEKGSFEVEVLTTLSLQEKILNYQKDKVNNQNFILGGNYTSVLEGIDITFDLMPEAKLLASKIDDANLNTFNVNLKLDNVKTNEEVTDKLSFSNAKTISFNLIDKSKKGLVDVRIYYDLDNKNHVFKNYEKGEKYLDFKFDVLSKEQAKKELKDSKSLDGLINYISSEKPIKLDSTDSIKIKGIDVSWTHLVNGKGVIDSTDLTNKKFGFIDLKTGTISDTYNVGNYYQVDLPNSGQVDLKLTVSYKVRDELLKTYTYEFKVKQGDTKALEENMENLIRTQLRIPTKLYNNLEYRLIDNEKYIFHNNVRISNTQMKLKDLTSFDVVSNASGSEVVQVNIEWLSSKNEPIINLDQTFEEVILDSIEGREPKNDIIAKTKIVAKCQYKIDSVSVITYVDFNINVFSNGITTNE